MLTLKVSVTLLFDLARFNEAITLLIDANTKEVEKVLQSKQYFSQQQPILYS